MDIDSREKAPSAPVLRLRRWCCAFGAGAAPSALVLVPRLRRRCGAFGANASLFGDSDSSTWYLYASHF